MVRRYLVKNGPLTAEQRLHLAQLWARSGQSEHASVAAFAKLILDLMAFGAPSHLIESAQQAMSDEIRHAKQCFSLMRPLRTNKCKPGPLEHLQQIAPPNLDRLLRGLILDGCVNETVAASLASHEGEAARFPEVRQILVGIARDEQRHAALSWQIVRWLLDEHPELRLDAMHLFDKGFGTSWRLQRMLAMIGHTFGVD